MNDRGVILISVLWIVLILSVTSLLLATAARTQVSATGNDFDSERAFFMARGAAEVMFYRMIEDGNLFNDSRVEQEGGEFIFSLETGEVRVRLETGRGRIDINRSSEELLASLFDSLGVERGERNRLVDSILDWRDADDIPNLYGAEISDYDQVNGQRLPANGSFDSVDELLFVNGMTPDLFYGQLVEDLDGGYRRIPGVQDLVTVNSDTGAVNPNEASVDVLAALPGLVLEDAQGIVRIRDEEAFSGSQDLIERVPLLNGSDALEFMTFGVSGNTSIVARAEVHPSGISRTVRMILRREDRLQILSLTPLMYRRVQDTLFDGWRYE